MGGRGSGSGMSGGGGSSIALSNNSAGLRSQVQEARGANGYKSAQVNEMISEAKSNGWKESYPAYNVKTGTVYRAVSTQGTGNLSNRVAKVHVSESGVTLRVTDQSISNEYSFSNVRDAIASGNRYVSNPKASTKKSGPKDKEFIVGRGIPKY